MADLKLPPDFRWSNDDPVTFEHRSGKKAHWPKWMPPLNQPEIDYLVHKVRIEYRRDRLFLAVNRNIDRFRRCQIAMRKRGYTI